VGVNAPEVIRFANGVRLVLDAMGGLETAAVGVWQRVGARWESAAQNGIAHLFEHMAFKGAGGRDARAFAEAIEAVGGSINAATSYERTAYYARVVGADVPLALGLIADILFAPHWRQDELEKEKGVVAQERGEAFDIPDDRVFELHQSALFAGQALGRPILGEAEALARVTVGDLEAFRDAHLAPERVVISIAGAFDRSAAIELIEARFASLSAKPTPELAPARATQNAVTEARKLEQTHLVLSWPAPAAGADQLMAARLLAEIYGGGMASRLFQEVREKRGLAYSIDAFLDVYEDAGRLMVYVGCEPKHAEEAARIVGEELAALAHEGPSEAEISRARASARANLLMGLEAPSARAEARASSLFLKDRVLSVADIHERINAAGRAQIMSLAEAALCGPVCAAAIGPKAGLGAPDRFVMRR